MLLLTVTLLAENPLRIYASKAVDSMRTEFLVTRSPNTHRFITWAVPNSASERR
jgi:hypothetical protein